MKRGFACGIFDLFHAGHVRMLKECKEHCDHLIVALNKAEDLPSTKNKPMFSIQERVEILKSCKYADEVLVYNGEKELYELMKNSRIDIRFLGEDYKDRPITGADLNIPIHYTDRGHGLSTSGWIRKIAEQYKN